MFAIDLDFKPPAENLFKDIKVLLRNVELMVFFVVNFMSGIYCWIQKAETNYYVTWISVCIGLFWGYIESYLFWFLEDMGGTKSLMGLTLTLSAISGIPVLILSDRIFRKIGHPNVQIIGFLVYVIRLVGKHKNKDSPFGCCLNRRWSFSRLFFHLRTLYVFDIRIHGSHNHSVDDHFSCRLFGWSGNHQNAGNHSGRCGRHLLRNGQVTYKKKSLYNVPR